MRILLDFNLEKLLLYADTGEQEQYNRSITVTDPSKDSLVHTGKKDASGNTHLKNDDSPEKSPKERPTDESKENQVSGEIKVHNIVAKSQHKPNLLSMAALRERRKVSLSVESKIIPTAEPAFVNSTTGLPSGACSSKGSSTSGRSSATPTQSLLTPPATSPTTPQVISIVNEAGLGNWGRGVQIILKPWRNQS